MGEGDIRQTVKTRQQLRQQARQARRALTESAQHLSAQQLVEQVASVPHLANANGVALYLANDGELDPRPLIHWYWARGCQVYLPVLHPFSAGHLLFLRYQADSLLHHNAFGIIEPKLDVRTLALKHELDIIFTPLVAFDSQGHRLGMGGGFYDRTLSAYLSASDGHPSPQVVGLAHDCQQLDALPVAHWDIPLSELVTPSRHLSW